MKCDTIQDLEKFLLIQEQALGDMTPEVATTLFKLAELYLANGDLGKAENLYQRSFEIRSVLHGYNRQGIEVAEQRLNEIRVARQSPKQSPGIRCDTAAPDTGSASSAAASTSAAASQAVPVNASPTESETTIMRKDLSPSISHSGLNTNRAVSIAIQDAELELELLKQMVGSDHSSVADLLTKIADLYCRLKMYNKMEPLLVDALKIREAACGPEHASVATELKNLGTLYCAQERFALAEPLLKRAISLRERAYGRSHPRVADVEAQYALLLRKTNRIAQAEALESHVNDIRNAHDSAPFSCDSSFFGAAVNKPRR